MTKVTLVCRGSAAMAKVEGQLTHGMVGVLIDVEWDTAWDGLLKTIKVRCGDVSRTVLVDGDSQPVIPYECLIAGQWLEIGMDGWDADGTLRIPSCWASCGMVKPSVAQVDAPEGAPPTPDALAKLQMLVSQAEEAAKNLASALEDAVQYASSADKSAGDAAGAASAAAGSASDADRSAGVASGAAAAASELVGKIPDFQTQINELDTGKVSKEVGKGLSANDYDDASKQKVDAIPEHPKYTDTVTPVDATLSIDGEAADAKTTGDALNQIKDDLADLQTTAERKYTVKTVMDSVAEPLTQYYLGDQTAVDIVLPDTADVGKIISVSWYNGDIAATMSITGTMLDFGFTPSANTRSEINALWDGTYWAVLGNEMEVPST